MAHLTLLHVCIAFTISSLKGGLARLIADVPLPTDLPEPTFSGYLNLSSNPESALFYAYYESEESPNDGTPIVLWLQVCSRQTLSNIVA